MARPEVENMQYLVTEIMAGSASPGEAKVFNSVSDAVKHIQKISDTKILWMGDKDKTTDQIEWALAEKLSTVTVTTGEKGRKWAITAF